MINGANGLKADCMQMRRIDGHPIPISGNLIITDDLEAGTIRIYEQTGGPVHIQQLFTGYGTIRNTVLVAEAVINSLWKEKGVFIHRMFCEDGYESLIQPMMYQILHFADFYGYESVGISDREYDRCLPYSKKVFAGFEKVNRVYEYRIDR